MALKIDEVIAVLNDAGVPADKVAVVKIELETVEQEKKEERASEKAPKAKNEYAIILNDPNNLLAGKDFTGYVVQVPEGESAVAVLDKIKRAAKTQNTTIKKFIKHPLKGLADACQNLRRKFTKTEKVHIKTKEPVLVVVSDGSL